MRQLAIPRLTELTHKDEVRLKVIHSIDNSFRRFSVNELCEAAGISRKSFYTCFSSKHDIFDWYSSYCERIYLNEIGRTLDIETGYAYHYALLDETTEAYQIYLRFYPEVRFNMNSIAARRYTIFCETLRDYRKIEVDDMLEFCVRAFTNLEASQAAVWSRAGLLDAELKARYMKAVMPSLLRDALETP
jgi:AcrR family transcriptional regulator